MDGDASNSRLVVRQNEGGPLLVIGELEALQLAVGRLHCGPWHEPAQLMGYIARLTRPTAE
jgi:hypothetical protein